MSDSKIRLLIPSFIHSFVSLSSEDDHGVKQRREPNQKTDMGRDPLGHEKDAPEVVQVDLGIPLESSLQVDLSSDPNDTPKDLSVTVQETSVKPLEAPLPTWKTWVFPIGMFGMEIGCLWPPPLQPPQQPQQPRRALTKKKKRVS